MSTDIILPNIQLNSVNGVLLSIIIVWSLIWKGLAMWKAARKSDKIWYVVLLVINTVGLLDIIYYYLIDRPKIDTDKPEK